MQFNSLRLVLRLLVEKVVEVEKTLLKLVVKINLR